MLPLQGSPRVIMPHKRSTFAAFAFYLRAETFWGDGVLECSRTASKAGMGDL
jgi:hypothetical protein